MIDQAKLHKSWKTLNWKQYSQIEKYCPMCAKKHTLLSYHKKTYCPYHDSELSGWDDKVYNVLINSLETAMIYLTDVGPLMTRKLEKTIPMMLAAKEKCITIEKQKSESKVTIEPVVQEDNFDYSGPSDEEVMQHFNRWINTGTSRPQPPAPPTPSAAEQAMLQQQQAMVNELARIRKYTHDMWLTND